MLQRIWAIGLIGKWFCIWQFSDNRKINLNLEPKPAVVPERQAVKKPLFYTKIFKFQSATSQIKPS